MQQISPKLPLLQGCTNPMYQLAVATTFDTVAPNITGPQNATGLCSTPTPSALRDFEMATRFWGEKMGTPALLQVCAA